MGAHRRSRKRRSRFTRTVVAGSAALCIGAASQTVTPPEAEAISILLPGPVVNGVGNTLRINILEGNIFNPQFGLNGTSSNNTTFGNLALNLGNNIINQFLSSLQINLGATGNGNVTQINILSYNIFNPQISLIGRNVSNNTTVNNVAANNGNHSTTDISAGGGLFPWLTGAAGNGNTTQFSFFSGNIFNPQWSILGGGNLSNNTTLTNVSLGNGNYSQATLGFGGIFGTFLFGGGNGNTFQFAFFVSNIYNPQWTFGGGNISFNTAATNTSQGNGNNSSNDVNGGGLGTIGGTTGNGNTSQTSTGSGNIYNDQVSIGPNWTSNNNNTTTTTTGGGTTDVLDQLGIQSTGPDGNDNNRSAALLVSSTLDTGEGDEGRQQESNNRQSQQEARDAFLENSSSGSTPTTGTAGNTTGDTPGDGTTTVNTDVTPDGDDAGPGDASPAGGGNTGDAGGGDASGSNT